MRDYDRAVRAVRECKMIETLALARKGIPTLRAGAPCARPATPKRPAVEHTISDFVAFSGSPNRAGRRKHAAIVRGLESYVERPSHRTNSLKLARMITRDAELIA